MPAGLMVFTDTGVIQIDETAPVLCLRYMGNSTVVNRHPASTNSASNLANTVDITVTAESPQIFLKGEAEGSSFSVIATVVSGNQWTFRVIGMDHSPRFSYFIFDKPVHTANGAGLEVYDADGRVMFSSLYRPMDIKGFSESDATINLQSGRQYAVAYNARITRTEWDDTGTDLSQNSFFTDYLKIASVNGGTVTVNTLPIAGGSATGGQGFLPIGPGLGGWGSDSTMVVVDVTGLVSAVTPASPIVSVSPSSLTATGSGSGDTTTGTVTATASGGSGSGYQYQWVQTLTDSRVVAVGATNTRYLQTRVVNQIAGSTIVARWQCKVTDSLGNVGFSDEVTTTHVQPSADYIPDPVSVANFAPNSADATAYGVPRDFRITGINQPITLRVLRIVTGGTGNVDRRWLNIRVSNDGTNFTLLKTLTATTEQFDFTVTNGQWVRLDFELSTSSGIVTSQWNIGVYNLSASGAEIAFLTMNGTVDNDNNYNVVDITPDTISNWPAITGSNGRSDAEDFEWSTSWYGDHYVTGINTPITVRFQAWGFNNPDGNIDFAQGSVFTWPPGEAGWIYLGSFNLTGQGYLDVANVVNGTRVAINPRLKTSQGKGRGTADVQLVLWSQPQGANVLFASAVSQLTVDNDNSSDRTPNTISFPTQTINTTGNYGAAGLSHTLAGFTGSIDIEVAISNVSGSISAGGLYFRKNDVDVGSPIIWTSGPTTRTGTFAPGDVLSLYIDAQTFSGAKTGQFFTTVTNKATGVTLGGFWTYCSVDTDNNYNVSDLVPDLVSFPRLVETTTDTTGGFSTAWYSPWPEVRGITGPITVQFGTNSFAGNMNALNIDCYVMPPGGGWVYHGTINGKTGQTLNVTNVVSGSALAMNPNVTAINGVKTCSVNFTVKAVEADVVFCSSTNNSFQAGSNGGPGNIE